MQLEGNIEKYRVAKFYVGQLLILKSFINLFQLASEFSNSNSTFPTAY